MAPPSLAYRMPLPNRSRSRPAKRKSTTGCFGRRTATIPCSEPTGWAGSDSVAHHCSCHPRRHLVLILDEATAFADPESEYVQQALNRLTPPHCW